MSSIDNGKLLTIDLHAVKHILIVEDSVINAVYLQNSLNELGYSNVFIATNGKEAIVLFSNKYDLIFMDINLPDMSGIELSKIYHNLYRKNDVPIICYSNDYWRHEKECINSEMLDYLPKPFTPEDLKRILENWLPCFNIGAKKYL